jgi:aminopeptidase N
MIVVGSGVVVGGCSAQQAGVPAAPPHPGIDVQHYDFALTLADTTDRIEGRAEVRLRVASDTLSAVRLDLLAPAASARGPDGTGMRVERVTKTGEDGSASETAFRQTPGHVVITPSDALREGQTRTFTIHYAGVPADGLIIGTNRHGDRTFFGDNWPNRARHWLPVVDHLSDKATVEFRVTAPERYRIVSNGALVADSTYDGRRTAHWRTDVPLPPKVMIIGVADFAVDSVATVDGVPVQSWVYPQDRERGFEDLGQAPEILRYFEEKIGPYPYPKLANVQSATRYGGMENASAIFYSEEAVADGRDSEELLAHEIAHQWYGNTATEADWPHLWLSEGFATYLTALWLEDTYGSERLAQTMQQARRRVLAFNRQNPGQPLVDTVYTDPNELLNVNPYQKGAWVLHMLRQEVGTDTFWEGLRAYYERYRHGNASTADFRRVMEEVSGQDLQAFFEQWTRRAAHPVLDAEWRHDSERGVCVIDLEQTQDGPPFSFPLDVAITTYRGRTETLAVTDRAHTFRVDCGRPPSEVTLDPNVQLLGEWTLERGR